jgi:hypothetical protein
MINLDAVRTAVLSSQPWSRLDEIVRAELAAGRTTREIFAELESMADAVEDTPGLSDDGHDAFGDTLDALIGQCSPRHCYQDPPKPPALPTQEESR